MYIYSYHVFEGSQEAVADSVPPVLNFSRFGGRRDRGTILCVYLCVVDICLGCEGAGERIGKRCWHACRRYQLYTLGAAEMVI